MNVALISLKLNGLHREFPLTLTAVVRFLYTILNVSAHDDEGNF